MNVCIFKGRLTKDPEVRYTQTNNTAVTNFSIAVDRDYVKAGEERQADFFNITVFGKLAEFASKYFVKGQEILIRGRLQNRTWDDENGVKHYATDIIADEINFCGKKSENANDISQTPVETTENNSDDLPF